MLRDHVFSIKKYDNSYAILKYVFNISPDHEDFMKNH